MQDCRPTDGRYVTGPESFLPAYPFGAMTMAQAIEPILVKRYARSRLYDTRHRCYVSVEQLRGWATRGIAFSVVDIETGHDVTRVLLA